jgi:hypothetical protein
MMQCHQAWAAMTDAQRRQWNQFISFSGATINRDKSVLLTGHALFLKYNILRLLSKLSILTSFSYSTILAFPVPADASTDGDSISIGTDTTFDGDELWAVVKLSSVRKPSLSFAKSGLHYMYTPWSNIVRSVFSFSTVYTDVYGAFPAVGTTIHYSCTFFSMTAPLIAQTISGTFVVAAA